MRAAGFGCGATRQRLTWSWFMPQNDEEKKLKGDCRPRKSLSVAIVTYAPSEEELAQTLGALSRAVRHGQCRGVISEVDLFLIDNGPDTRFTPMLESLLEDERLGDIARCRVLTGQGNVGFGRGHNLALAESRADLHLVLNPDVRMDEEALVHGVAFLVEREDVVMVSPQAVWPDGRRQYLCKRYPSLFDLVMRGFAPAALRRLFDGRLSRYEMRDVCDRDEPAVGIPIASGCFMLAKRDALNRVGGFSDEFFLYFEDFDLSLRLRQIGAIAYLPAVRIVHAGGHAARKGFAHVKMFGASALTFYRRHGWKFF